MIIRRRQTANFSIITNAVFDDTRLTIEERGALAWLLSRPNNWEVSRPACAKLWNLGRDKAKRILTRLVETGWAQAEMQRAGDGTFLGVRYVVSDQCGPEQTFREEDEILAPSVASQPQPENPSTDDPSTDEPSTENQSTVISTESYQGLPTQTLPSESVEAPQEAIQGKEAGKRESSQQAASPPEGDPALERDWQTFQSSYPDGVIDLDKAKIELANLSPIDRKACLGGVLLYAERCQRRREKAMRAHLFVRKQVWKGLKVEASTAARFVVLNSPEGSVVRVLAGLMGETRPPPHWYGRDPTSGRSGYWIRFGLTPRLLALAEADAIKRHQWPKFPVGSGHHGAWDTLLREAIGKHVPVEGGSIRAPWPWPPRVDGTIGPAEPSTGPPITPPLTNADAEEFTTGLG